LVINDARIGVVHSTVTADQQLRLIFLVEVGLLPEELTESDIRVYDARDTLGRVEASDLYDVVAFRPSQRIHLFFRAEVVELAHVVLGVPRGKLLVEAIEPSREQVH
jgi:hypothetical protein